MMRRALLIALLLVTGFCIGIAYATSFSETYDIATPAGSDDPAEADDRMREIKAAVQERLAVEHRFALTGTEVSAADTGEHTDITTDSIVNAGAYSGTTIAASGTLDVAGNIDPTTYETTNGGFLDEDDMASDANDKVASQQSIKKYVEDQISASLPDDDAFGSWASKSNNTVYQAASDGFVLAIPSSQARGYTDGGASPTTLRGTAEHAGGQPRGHICMPVKKSDYWKVTNCSTVYWLPIGG